MRIPKIVKDFLKAGKKLDENTDPAVIEAFKKLDEYRKKLKKGK